MGLLKKVLKFSGILFIAVFLTANIFILLSGKFYIYTGISNTYLVGETGPTIYDLDVFPYSTILPSKEKFQLHHSTNYNQFDLSKETQQFFDIQKTTAFLVIKNDSLIFENYYEKHTEETVSNSFSAIKTLVSILIGIAIEDEAIGSIDDKVCDYLPEFCNHGKEKITIRHLLTMSSGLSWTESTKNPFSNNAESYYGTDLHQLVTQQTVVSEPGQVFNYQSGNTQILGYIIEKATGEDLSEYAQRKVWKKIGAEHEAYWSLDKENGDEKSFCCWYATPRDYSRLGLLLLHKGRMNDEQIIPLDYFNEMVRPADLLTKMDTPNYCYGLQTWVYLGGNHKVNYYRGASGQYIISIPEEKLVIVRLGEKRSPNFAFTKEELKEKSFFEENKYKVEQSSDFIYYLELGKKISQKIN